MSLRVIEPGLYTLIVDLGRPGSRSLGVPVGGAADRTALLLGNGLVGNPPDAAALEISLAGPTLRAGCDLACVLTGAPFELSCGSRSLQAGHTFTLHEGEVLHIRGTPAGMRGYLCIRGGIAAPVILGSRSSLQPLTAGTELACQPGTIGGRFVQVEWQWDTTKKLTSIWKSLGMGSCHVVHVLDGPQADWYQVEELEGFDDDWESPSFTVTNASNRMGLRLQGAPLRLPARELVSEPVCPGAVQATRDGQLIVLGVDGQTIGGYPKIAQVIGADLDKLGQLRPGEKLVFQRVPLEEAEQLFRDKAAELRQWLLRLRTTSGIGGKAISDS